MPSSIWPKIKKTSKPTSRRKPADLSTKPVTKTLYKTRKDFPGQSEPGAWKLYIKYFTHGAEPSSTFDLRTELDIADVVDQGVSTDAVFDAIDSGVLEANTVYNVVVPRRTLTHRKGKRQRLSREESDRLARVLRVHARAERALGDPAKAARWLSKQNRALNGRIPIDLLSSDAGSRAVEKVIGRIEHGILS